MAVVACASRFAVLKLEDDEISESLIKKNVPPTNQAGKNRANQKNATETKSKTKKKKKNANEIAELQNLAFGTHSTKKQKSSNIPKTGQASAKQWEEWKQKDNVIVSEAYEQDLQEALLMSKIDYEEKKDVYDALAKEAELSKLGLQKKKKKSNQKKDKGIMSLDEFQSLDSNNKHLGSPKDYEEIDLPLKAIPIEDANFFNKIEEDAEKIINKEQKQDKHKAVDPIEESARFHQYQEDLNSKDKEISVLKENVAKLKEELKNVKLRNKKLLGILESGEMREKAEILVQIDQLLAVKDELTEQVSEYHTSLEQERSKVHALQMELKKCQNSKKQRTESK